MPGGGGPAEVAQDACQRPFTCVWGGKGHAHPPPFPSVSVHVGCWNKRHSPGPAHVPYALTVLEVDGWDRGAGRAGSSPGLQTATPLLSPCGPSFSCTSLMPLWVQLGHQSDYTRPQPKGPISSGFPL